MEASDQTLFIPVILGTVRQGRLSEHVARFVCQRQIPLLLENIHDNT